jgi:hypothetical protein
MFVRACRPGLERDFVVLPAPRRPDLAGHDLRGEDERDGPFDRGASRVAAATVDERKGGIPDRDLLEQRQHVDHRVVVERDVTRVIVSKRKELWPAPVGVLGGEQVVNPAERRRVVWLAGAGIHHRKKPDLGGCRAVVDRGVRRGRGGHRRWTRHVDVLRPAAGGALVEQDDARDCVRLRGRVPGGRLVQDVAPLHPCLQRRVGSAD